MNTSSPETENFVYRPPHENLNAATQWHWTRWTRLAFKTLIQQSSCKSNMFHGFSWIFMDFHGFTMIHHLNSIGILEYWQYLYGSVQGIHDSELDGHQWPAILPHLQRLQFQLR